MGLKSIRTDSLDWSSMTTLLSHVNGSVVGTASYTSVQCFAYLGPLS